MLEKYFSYYKREGKCPFPTGSVEWFFWSFERQFNVKNRNLEQYLLAEAANCRKSLLRHKARGGKLSPYQERFLTFSEGKQALALFFEAQAKSFCPGNWDETLLEY